MAQRERILEFLASARGPICDDCLSEQTRITPRQTINQHCNRMAQHRKVVRGQDHCRYCRSPKLCNHVQAGQRIVPPPPGAVTQTQTQDRSWHWEGNVQAALVSWLRASGWTIEQAADTAARSAGKDIIAVRDGRTLWVSVKGFPNATPRTHPATQARHWFSHAVFDMAMYRDESDSVELAIGLPSGFVTYENLAERVRWLRANLPFRICWVDESGGVRVE